MLCRHCCRNRANRPKALCWGCYYKPGVRSLYPSDSKFAVRGFGNFNGGYVPPQSPTRAVPGSADKIAELARRAEAGTSLFHPDDEKRPEE